MLVGLGALVLGCAKSETPDWTAACFESRELEAWDERWPASCELKGDLDADGEIDGRAVTEHDARGRTVEVTSDLRAVLSERWEYDDGDRVLVHEVDDLQGALAYREEREYDEDGRLIASAVDEDGDAVVETVARPEYESCVEVVHEPCSIAYDVDGDGETDGVSITMRDLLGRRLSALQYDPSTRMTAAERYFYEDGLLSRTEIDVGDDGTIDEIRGTDYDDNGAQLRDWHDTDADGERDWWVEYERAADDARTVTTVYERGAAVERHVFEYDERRNRVRISVRDESTPEADYDSVFRYDAAGNQVATARDFYPFGSADECYYVSYACWDER